MELNLSPEQELVRSTTHTFLEREASSARLRALAQTTFGFERSWWSTAAELGWTSLLVPEDLDGGSLSGRPLEDLAILVEEAGHFAAPGPLAIANTVLVGLTYGGNRDHADAIAGIMSGAVVATWAVYEPGQTWSPLRPTLLARAVDGGYRLNGVKDRVEAGDQADIFLVTAALDGQVRQFLVPATQTGVSVQRVWSLDFTRHYATVKFDHVLVPPSAIVGTAAETGAAIERQSQTILALQSVEISGATERVLGMTLKWAMDRFVFGRPLASYQAIKHRFANMKTWIEAMHAIGAAAVKAVQDEDREAARLSRAAKIFVSTRAGDIIQDCVQIHGGMGVTWECDLHLFLRRATVNRVLYGTPEEHRHTLARLLEEDRIPA